LIKILVVDDDRDIRKILELLLGKEGFKVESAGNAFYALRLIKNTGDYDLMITDVEMPVMNGFELSRQAKKLRHDLKILGISGSAIPHDQAERFFDYFIPKPFDVHELMVGVNYLLNRSAAEFEKKGCL